MHHHNINIEEQNRILEDCIRSLRTDPTSLRQAMDDFALMDLRDALMAWVLNFTNHPPIHDSTRPVPQEVLEEEHQDRLNREDARLLMKFLLQHKRDDTEWMAYQEPEVKCSLLHLAPCLERSVFDAPDAGEPVLGTWSPQAVLLEDNKNLMRDLPLHSAAECGALHCLKRFLEVAPNTLEAKNIGQRTPFVVAVLNNHIEAARYLWAQGADPYVCFWKGPETIPSHEALTGSVFDPNITAWLKDNDLPMRSSDMHVFLKEVTDTPPLPEPKKPLRPK